MPRKNNNGSIGRLDTSINNEIMVEHLHRYALAQTLAEKKIVLDIACGEGYGSNLLANSATQVIGIDIDESVVKKANKKYKKNNINFETGSINAIPIEDNRFDLITCFETIEHVDDHIASIKELKRVLKDTGILLISSPDKLNFSDKSGYKNPFHLKELYEKEFKEMILDNFHYVLFLKQSPVNGSLITSETQSAIQSFYTGNYESIQKINAYEPLFWIAIASDNKISELPSSIFSHEKTISQIQDEQTILIKKSLSYKIGNFILSPFKFIRTLLNK